jgi:hypothetical protein
MIESIMLVSVGYNTQGRARRRIFAATFSPERSVALKYRQAG